MHCGKVSSQIRPNITRVSRSLVSISWADMNIVALFSLFLNVSVCYGLRSLFETSNPSLSWPPSGRDFIGSIENWPGQGEQLGESWPRIVVSNLTTLPTTEDFLREYVSKRTPVVLSGLYEQMTDFKSQHGINLAASEFQDSPHAAISKIEAFRYGHGIKERMTFRELLGKISKNEDQDKWYTYGHIPYSVKEIIRYPAPLRCPKIAFQTMVETRQLFYNIEVSKPIRQELNHQLYCMVEGEKEIVLIDEADFPSWSTMKLVDDGYSGKLNPFVDVSKIDYNTHPALKDIKKFHIAKLQAGDCLFVPARWIHQQNVLDKDNSLEIRWRPLENESDLDCSGYLSPILTLGDLPWLGENIAKPPERSTDPKRHAFKRLLHLLQRVVLTNQAKDITDFSSIIKTDPFLAPELPKWDDDCQEISETLFHLLDRNKDGKLTANDLDNILELDVDHWANLIHDQLSLLAEVIFDMRVDLAGAIPLDETIRQRVIQMIDIKEKQILEHERAALEEVAKLAKDEL